MTALRRDVVALARYMRQDLATIERMSLDEVREHLVILSEFIASENGGGKDGSPSASAAAAMARGFAREDGA